MCCENSRSKHFMTTDVYSNFFLRMGMMVDSSMSLPVSITAYCDPSSPLIIYLDVMENRVVALGSSLVRV